MRTGNAGPSWMVRAHQEDVSRHSGCTGTMGMRSVFLLYLPVLLLTYNGRILVLCDGPGVLLGLGLRVEPLQCLLGLGLLDLPSPIGMGGHEIRSVLLR